MSVRAGSENEAALTKLYCLLGGGRSVGEVRRLMEQDLAGEVHVG